MNGVSGDKAALRRAALSARDALSTENRIQYSLDAADHAAEFLAFEAGTIIAAFLPIRSEIDARPLMDDLRKRGARLCLPVVLDRQTIIFRELIRGAQLIATGFGTTGPGPEAAQLQPQIMIMPLAAYDSLGNRIGYGAGHYDRAIARLDAQGQIPRLIGLAFSVQRVANIVAQPHDRAMNAVITETGVEIFDEQD